MHAAAVRLSLCAMPSVCHAVSGVEGKTAGGCVNLGKGATCSKNVDKAFQLRSRVAQALAPAARCCASIEHLVTVRISVPAQLWSVNGQQKRFESLY